MPTSLRPAVFLDRDGVINENRANYVRVVDHVRFIPGALAALARLAQWDCAIVVVTNQSSIGRGLVTLAVSDAINAHVREHVEQAGGRVDAFYVCPHEPNGGCACRKPEPGLLRDAAADLGLDPSRSYMIGDALTDVLAGQRAGAQPILVLTGRGATQAPLLERDGLADVPVVADLEAAVALIEAAAGSAWVKKTPPVAGGTADNEAILP